MRRSFSVFALVLSLSIAILCGCGGAGHSSPSSQTTTPTTPAQNPVPTISAISPASLIAGSDAQTITITGTGFMSSSAVTMDGKALTTSYVSDTSVTASVPASAIASDGTSSITVANPTPGGGTSAAQSFKIAVPVGKITSLSPQVVPQGQAATITITGAGFEAKSVVQWNGSARPTTL